MNRGRWRPPSATHSARVRELGAQAAAARCVAHVIIRSRVAGEPYENQFAQFLTLRWGRVVEDVILEDTATWEAGSSGPGPSPPVR
jgi:hypothetical protein